MLGTLNVAQAAEAAGAQRVVHVSTSEVYGQAAELPITEAHPLQAQSPYAASKVGADQLMASWHRSRGLPVTIVRPFNTYGPFQSMRAIVPTIVTQALAGGPIRLGSLEPRRDLTYVADTVAGMLAAATAGDDAVGRTIQLGTGTDVSVGELAALVAELLGVDAAIEHDPVRVRPPDSEIDRLVSDPTLARELLGWEAQTSLRDGLERTAEWIERRLRPRDAHEYVT